MKEEEEEKEKRKRKRMMPTETHVRNEEGEKWAEPRGLTSGEYITHAVSANWLACR